MKLGRIIIFVGNLNRVKMGSGRVGMCLYTRLGRNKSEHKTVQTFPISEKNMCIGVINSEGSFE